MKYRSLERRISVLERTGNAGLRLEFVMVPKGATEEQAAAMVAEKKALKPNLLIVFEHEGSA